MKNDQLHTYLCSAGISFCLGLGAVGAMATGLELPVRPMALVICCIILAALIAGLACLRFGSLISLGLGSIFLLNPDFWTELKTVAAALALRLNLGYGIPVPAVLQGELSKQVLSALCLLGALVMVASAWAVQRRKTVIPAAILSLLPLACCITVVDTVPQSMFLFLWGLGLILLLMTQGSRRQSPRRGNQLTALLVIPTALILVFLFWLIPRDAPSRWAVADLPGKVLSYFTESSSSGPNIPGPQTPQKVDLSALQQREQRQTAVMEVTAKFDGPLYLRGRDYDEYTGTGWHSTPGRTEELYGFLPEWYIRDGFVEISVRQAQNFYYLPAMTQQIQLISDGQAANPELAKNYQFDYCRIQDDWKSKWEDNLVSTVHPRYLQLPEETHQGIWDYLSAQQALQSTMVQDLSVPAVAEEIRLFLEDHVPYDLATPNMPEGETDLALWFLNDAESGYCVHYATAAVVLLRANGIPARYVEGYAIRAQKDRTVTVRELHAHAWAEYYVNGIGWLVLEATPAGGTAPEEPAESTQPTETEPTVTTVPTEPTVPTAPGNPDQTPGGSPKHLPSWLKPLLVSGAWTLVALVLLWGQYRLRRRLFRYSHRRGSLNRRALVIYRRLCRLSKWTGKPVCPEMTQLAQKARFSHHTLTPAELSQLLSNLNLSEASVSLLPLYKRFFAKWLFARY